MASLAVASSVPISMSLACTRPIFSLTSSVRVTLTASFPAPLSISGVPQHLCWIARASPHGTQNTSLEETVQHAIEEAQEVCTTEEISPKCAEAWDEVEELSATLAHKKVSEKEANLLESSSKEVQKPSPQGTILDETVKHAIKEAEEVCAAEEASAKCAEAWDEVEELAAAVAHKKLSGKEDPLESIRG